MCCARIQHLDEDRAKSAIKSQQERRKRDGKSGALSPRSEQSAQSAPSDDEAEKPKVAVPVAKPLYKPSKTVDIDDLDTMQDTELLQIQVITKPGSKTAAQINSNEIVVVDVKEQQRRAAEEKAQQEPHSSGIQVFPDDSDGEEQHSFVETSGTCLRSYFGNLAC